MPDLVDEVVEEDDVAAPLRHLRSLTALGQVHELVEQNLDAVGVVAEHPRDRRVPVARAVMVGAEHVDRPVEAAVELVGEVDDVGGAVGRRARLGADQHPVLVVAVRGRARPDGPVLLVRVQPRQVLGQPLLELALHRPGVEVDPEALERRLDPVAASAGTGSSGSCRQLGDVVALVAVLGRLLPAPPRLDGGAELLHLGAGVVVVVLALDVVPGELEQPRDRVAVGAVPRGGDDDRARRVRRDHLDLHPLLGRAEPPPYASPAARISASASPYQAGVSQRLTKPGPAISARSTSGSAAACSTSSSAIARGGCLRVPASRSAAFVA